MPRPASESPAPRSTERDVRPVTEADLDDLTARAGLAPEQRLQVRAVAAVLGSRTTRYVIEELIDWSDAPGDPIYQLVFSHQNMLPADVTRIAELLQQNAPSARVEAAAQRVRSKLASDHVSHLGAETLPGLHRTYYDTVLVVPAREPTGMIADDVHRLTAYLNTHLEVTGVRLAGTAPLALGASTLRHFVEPLLALDQLDSIQIDSSALARQPHRFLTDPDADDTLRLFEEVTASGKALSLAAAFCHPRELRPAPVAEAARRIHDTGAVIRTQGTLLGSVNDTAEAWAAMWRAQVRMGMVPHSMIISRPAGADGHTIPLARAHDIFTRAYARIAGLGRTVRGPVMLTDPGTVCVDGISNIGAQKVFVLRFTHARDPALTGALFFAAFDPDATWFTDLEPVFGPFPHQSDA